ncbi:hypothetical protein GCM10009853_067300 [Glycomyces scopariae]
MKPLLPDAKAPAMTNVFVLCTGRCGSVTFAASCEHLDNYTVGHESLAKTIGPDRFAYPSDHIEVDNRLAWHLGRLAAEFDGRDVKYVHLLRDPEEVARSLLDRWNSPYRASMIRAYGHGVVMRMHDWPEAERIDVCRDFVATVTANIEDFLEGRDSMTVRTEKAVETMPDVFDWIGAEGDIDAALAEWGRRHNETTDYDRGIAAAED